MRRRQKTCPVHWLGRRFDVTRPVLRRAAEHGLSLFGELFINLLSTDDLVVNRGAAASRFSARHQAPRGALGARRPSEPRGCSPQLRGRATPPPSARLEAGASARFDENV